MIHLKQYGEMRSGTNVIAKMIQLNLADEIHVITHGPGSKHYSPDYEAIHAWPNKPLYFLISARDPYSWMYGVLSLSKRRPGLGSQVLDGNYDPTTTFQNGELHRKLIARYNRHYADWLALYDKWPDWVYVVHLEDIFEAPEVVILNLARWLNLEFPRTIRLLDREALPGKITQLGAPFNRQQFYLRKAYLRHLPDRLLTDIRQQVDWGVMDRYGYTKE